MFANDRGWVRRMHEAIRNGLSAEAAVEKGAERPCGRGCLRQTVPFPAEASYDFDDHGQPAVALLIKPHGPGATSAQGRHHRGGATWRRRAARL